MVYRTGEENRKIISGNPDDNCINDLAQRAGGIKLSVEMTVNGTGAISANIFKVNGSVDIIDAYGEITEITTLTNLTNGKFFLYDGTNSVDITADGFSLSGVSVGSIILKTLDSSNAATIVNADQCRVTEADTSKKTHHPFMVTQKNGADTYLKCSMSTTDNPVNFKVKFYVVYKPLDGGSLEEA